MEQFESLGVGARCGDYTVLGKLGEGSSSVVFEGLQSGEGFARKVAIKVILGTAPSSLPQSETRILAQLEHPQIARLLDAGRTGSGLRFLVMELVQGVPCTQYVEEQKLSERDRLALFLEICQAVHHANRALVIHCDLKPANILVSRDGAVKLLDFGIARLLSEAEPSTGDLRPQRYTANYASPEQILGKPLTMATDVFSLGALLCELVSGQPVRDLAGVSFDELIRRADEDVAPAALSGDLAAIARKALRADPARRYANVGELAADVERYRDGRPIEARRASFGYKAGKLLRRHWRASLAAAAASIAILGGTAAAVRQQALAQERFKQIRELANAMMFEVHDEIAKLPGSLQPRHLIVNRSVTYLDTLAKSAASDDDVQLEVARGLLRLADIEGVGNEPSLGRSGQAIDRVDQAHQIVRAVAARNPRSLPAKRVLYQVLETRAAGDSLRAEKDSVSNGEALLTLARENAAAAPGDGAVQEELAHALAVRANAYTQSRTHNALGVGAWRGTVAAWKRLLDEKPDSMTRKRELARSYQYLAGALVRAAQREEGREMALTAYRMHKELEKVPGEEVEHMIAADVGLIAVVSAQLKQFDKAIPMFEEQLRLREAVAARDPGNYNALLGVGGTLDRIGTAYLRLNQPAKGLPYLQRSLETQRRVYAQDPANVLSSREMLYVLADLSEAHGVLHQRAAMCRYAVEGAAIMKGAIARTRETATDAAKKARLRAVLSECGVKE